MDWSAQCRSSMTSSSGGAISAASPSSAGDRVEQLQPGRVVVGGRCRGGTAGPGDQPVEGGAVTQRLGERPSSPARSASWRSASANGR